MAVEYFTAAPGASVLPSAEDPAMLLIAPDLVPDTVRLPAELGGGERAVLGVKRAACVCGAEHEARRFDLGDGLGVAECLLRGEFLWYRSRASGSEIEKE